MKQIAREEIIELLRSIKCDQSCDSGTLVHYDLHGDVAEMAPCPSCRPRIKAIIALQAAEPVGVVKEHWDSKNTVAFFDATDVPIGTKLFTIPCPPAKACDHCNSTGEVETDNNGPIVPCPLCPPAKAQAQAQAQVTVAELPPFAKNVIEKLRRVDECFSDAQDADIGRHWLDLLTQLGLLNQVQDSPAMWEISQQGVDALATKAQQVADITPSTFTYEAQDGDRFAMPESCPGGVVAIHLDGNRWSVQPAKAQVPELLKESGPYTYDAHERGFVQGWNSCRKAMPTETHPVADQMSAGWKQVPVEPDRDHLVAGACDLYARFGNDIDALFSKNHERLAIVYKVLIANAPKPESEDVASPKHLRQALHDIAYSKNKTATPDQFARFLQKIAADALTASPAPEHSGDSNEMPGWEPIETAPMDGTHIQVYRPKIQFIGYYGGANSGWRHNAPGLDSVWPLPTHWMPLPNPPQQEEAER